MKEVDGLLASINAHSFEKSDWTGKLDFSKIPHGKKEELFNLLDKVKDTPIIISILAFLFNESHELRDKLRTLDIGIRSNQFSIEKKKSFLQRYYSLVSKEQINISEDNYKGYFADFKMLSSMVEAQIGNFDLAIRMGEDAIQEYKEIGDNQRYRKVEEIIREWQLTQRGKNYIIPLEKLSTERINIQREIQEFQKEFDTLRTNFQKEKENHDKALRALETQRQKLEKEILQLTEQINELRSNSDSLQQKITAQNQLIKQNQPFLSFLKVMPKLVETPLWIEVLRLALIQGEIDELVWQVLNRFAEINLETDMPEFQELILRAADSDFDTDLSLIRAYVPFYVEIKKISEIIPNDPQYAASLICAVWEKMLGEINEEVLR